ncbi:MAG: hypothetical protein CMM50_05875 [Rhodospirillaceae bacterium]|nr:hypothetical protein [Rhodospirillaceae bacterium]
MRSTSPALGVLGLLIVAVIAAALYTTGGPLTARAERRDEVRHGDLNRLVDYVQCVADKEDGQPPETLSRSSDCWQDIRLNDPYSGEPYRYEKLSDVSFRVCATFETEQPERASPMPDDRFDPSSGCLYSQSYTRRLR